MTSEQSQRSKSIFVQQRMKQHVITEMEGIVVHAGATSHINKNVGKFETSDDLFKPETHSVELADGTKCSGIAQQRGTAVISLLDSAGQQHRAKLRDALFMPSYISS